MSSVTEEIIHLGTLSDLSKFLAEAIGYIGIIIMMCGAIKGLWMFLVQVANGKSINTNIRIELGQYLTLGLEFLIGKDIIESLVHPTWNDLGKLGAIILLRSILTLFIERELKHAGEEEARMLKFEKQNKKMRR